ncbi:cytochrome P460 family protein [Deinococcus cellulosilyticus]|uniref:Cytochrome P460 domain-containing protein n=1 Tax=Deinococcus cellulosilyticus (strain DSM 18568 / NBRC 106333 / KACC 11606 / 5516J-15) TaxID=1223518 RepID=A0A511N5E2_DEIC1|nr:cytochrome P460 family protein [Deinococcus cellulosilyticus]GEM48072.1 hypothetical protein DC3_37070 [Deinococcus cellulosilyticus NBRC 106333 = KACC 11606]
MKRVAQYALAGLLLVSSTPVRIPSPQENPDGAAAALPYPEHYRETMTLYAVVDRPDGMVRKLYVSQSALKAVQSKQPYPTSGDALYVIENYRAQSANQKYLLDAQRHMVPKDIPETIHVMQRRANKAGAMDNWNVQSFFYNTGEIEGRANLFECWACHVSAEKREFVFSRPVLQRFLASGQVQRWDCPKINRQLCDQHLDPP